jgi:hypothetical protein
VAVAAVLALAACGDGGADEAGDASGASDGAVTAVAEDAVVYQGGLTVLQKADADVPELCGMATASIPPICGGIPVSGWDWESVEHETLHGVRWGDYIVTGVFDGESLVLTEDPVSKAEVDMADYPHLLPEEPEFPEPAEVLPVEELEASANEVMAAFPGLLYWARVDEAHSVVLIHALLATPELEAYAAERFPEGAVLITPALVPIG